VTDGHGVNVHIPSGKAVRPGRHLVPTTGDSHVLQVRCSRNCAQRCDAGLCFRAGRRGLSKIPQVSKAYNPHLRTSVGRSMEALSGPRVHNPFQ